MTTEQPAPVNTSNDENQDQSQDDESMRTADDGRPKLKKKTKTKKSILKKPTKKAIGKKAATYNKRDTWKSAEICRPKKPIKKKLIPKKKGKKCKKLRKSRCSEISYICDNCDPCRAMCDPVDPCQFILDSAPKPDKGGREMVSQTDMHEREIADINMEEMEDHFPDYDDDGNVRERPDKSPQPVRKKEPNDLNLFMDILGMADSKLEENAKEKFPNDEENIEDTNLKNGRDGNKMVHFEQLLCQLKRQLCCPGHCDPCFNVSLCPCYDVPLCPGDNACCRPRTTTWEGLIQGFQDNFCSTVSPCCCKPMCPGVKPKGNCVSCGGVLSTHCSPCKRVLSSCKSTVCSDFSPCREVGWNSCNSSCKSSSKKSKCCSNKRKYTSNKRKCSPTKRKYSSKMRKRSSKRSAFSCCDPCRKISCCDPSRKRSLTSKKSSGKSLDAQFQTRTWLLEQNKKLERKLSKLKKQERCMNYHCCQQQAERNISSHSSFMLWQFLMQAMVKGLVESHPAVRGTEEVCKCRKQILDF